jgi:hypothetical protein
MPKYVATINVSGYLPQDDELAVFDDVREAWAYLAGERERAEDDAYSGDPGAEYSEDYSPTFHVLDGLGNGGRFASAVREAGLTADGRGTVYGPTPSYDGDRDLGLAYSVDYWQGGESE